MQRCVPLMLRRQPRVGRRGVGGFDRRDLELIRLEASALKLHDRSLRRDIAAAREALRQTLQREREILLIASQPWRAVTGGAPMHFSPTVIRNAARRLIRSLPSRAKQAAARRVLASIRPSEYSAAAHLNRAVRDQLLRALRFPQKKIAPLDLSLMQRLKAWGPFATGELITRAGASRLRRYEKRMRTGSTSATSRRRLRAALQKRRCWSDMTSALAGEKGRGRHRRVTDAMMSIADKVTGLRGASPNNRRR